MSSLEAALYSFSLEESWESALRKWGSGTAQQKLECRSQVGTLRDHLLYLVQDAEEEGRRDEAVMSGYALLRSQDNLLALRIAQREKRERPDELLVKQRELLASLLQIVEPHVPPARREGVEKFLQGIAPPEPEPAAEEEAPPAKPARRGRKSAPVAPETNAEIEGLKAEQEKLQNRLDGLLQARARLEGEFGTGDPITIIAAVRDARTKLTEAEDRLAPLTVERDALTREFGSFSATQIIAQVRLLKDRNAELHQQVTGLMARLSAAPAPDIAPVGPLPADSGWEEERAEIEKAVAEIESLIGLAQATLETAELQPLPLAA